jgi:putative flippase GtrA
VHVSLLVVFRRFSLIRAITAIIAHPAFARLSDWMVRLPLVGGLWDGLVRNPKRIERFIKFAIVGTIGALVDFTVLNIMKLVFEATGFGEAWDVSANTRQIQLAAANTISFSTAVLSNFSWNRLWTFPESRERPLGTQLVQFTIVNIAGLAINTLILVGLDQYVLQHILPTRLSYNLAKAVAICVVLFWNFGINLIWTYRGIE